MHKTRLIVDGHKAMLEVADNPISMAIGLSNRPWLLSDCGMLFDPGSLSNQGFWMKDTFVPLTLAFLDGDQNIFETHDLTPMSMDIIAPTKPWRWAIEMSSGWFSGIKLPAKCTFDM